MVCCKKNESREWNVESYDYLCWELLLFKETTYITTSTPKTFACNAGTAS